MISFSKPPKVGIASCNGIGEWSRAGIVGIVGGVPIDSLLVSDSCRARFADKDLVFAGAESFTRASLLTPRETDEGELVDERFAADAEIFWNRPRCRPGRVSGDVSEMARLSSLSGSTMIAADAGIMADAGWG